MPEWLEQYNHVASLVRNLILLFTHLKGMDCCLSGRRFFGSGKHGSPLSSEQLQPCPVSAHNEWDLLEEAIVGRIEGHCVPPMTTEVKAILTEDKWQFYNEHATKEFPMEVIEKAKKEWRTFVLYWKEKCED